MILHFEKNNSDVKIFFYFKNFLKFKYKYNIF